MLARLTCFVLASFLVLDPVVAQACSRPGPCPPTRAFPPDGATDVPLNVELEGYLAGESGSRSGLVLRVAETGEEVPLVAGRTPGRMRAEALLLPSTRYELYVTTQRWAAPDECTDELVLGSTFTTGDAEDVSAPTDVRASGPSCSPSVCSSGACCGPYVAAFSSVGWGARDDGALPLAYAFGSPRGPRTFATSGAALQCSGCVGPEESVLAPRGRMPGSGPIYAIDAAGNVSVESASFTHDFSCFPPPEAICDGGLCPSIDGGPNADGGTTPTSSGGGCAVGGHGGSSPWAIAALAILACWRRRAARRA